MKISEIRGLGINELQTKNRELAEELFRSLAAALPSLGEGVRLRRVRIWETASCWAEFEPDQP